MILEGRHVPSLIREVKEHLRQPDHHRPQGVQHLPRGCGHVLGDRDPGEVKEGDGHQGEGEEPVQLRLVVHLDERVWDELDIGNRVIGYGYLV